MSGPANEQSLHSTQQPGDSDPIVHYPGMQQELEDMLSQARGGQRQHRDRAPKFHRDDTNATIYMQCEARSLSSLVPGDRDLWDGGIGGTCRLYLPRSQQG